MLNFFTFIVITLSVLILLYKYKLFLNFKKRNSKEYMINKWMKLSKDQRNIIDEREKKISMYRKKSLLKDIRREYKKVASKETFSREPFIPKK